MGDRFVLFRYLSNTSGFPSPMNDNSLNSTHDWPQRAAKLEVAIRRAFPMQLIDQERLRILLADAVVSPNSAAARKLGFVWNDDELIDVLRLLRHREWIDIDWKSHWPAIPLLPNEAFGYCLPGIMHWIVTDPDFMFEAAEGLVEDRLAPPPNEDGKTCIDFSVFTREQQEVIATFLCLLHDVTLRHSPRLQESVETVVRSLLGARERHD